MNGVRKKYDIQVIYSNAQLCGIKTGKQWGLDQCVVSVHMDNRLNVEIKLVQRWDVNDNYYVHMILRTPSPVAVTTLMSSKIETTTVYPLLN